MARNTLGLQKCPLISKDWISLRIWGSEVRIFPGAPAKPSTSRHTRSLRNQSRDRQETSKTGEDSARGALIRSRRLSAGARGLGRPRQRPRFNLRPGTRWAQPGPVCACGPGGLGLERQFLKVRLSGTARGNSGVHAPSRSGGDSARTRDLSGSLQPGSAPIGSSSLALAGARPAALQE